MKRWIRENISVIIVFGVIFWIGISSLVSEIKSSETYFYNYEEAEEMLLSSNYGTKVPNYEGYTMESITHCGKKYDKNYYGTMIIYYNNGDKRFGYRSGKIPKGYKYEDNFEEMYQLNFDGKIIEIPYDKMKLRNTTLYYIDSSKYELFKDGFYIDGNSYFWSIDGISYSTEYIDSNIEHEEIVKIIESME